MNELHILLACISTFIRPSKMMVAVQIRMAVFLFYFFSKRTIEEEKLVE